MSSLRTASPRLRKYFKENYIPQICEESFTTSAPPLPAGGREHCLLGLYTDILNSLSTSPKRV
ncbi:Hypothetical predicted protein [Marmota monax]|uniref:Uncharacterized protein n=1 Tax=Marmota monax TaxID=9995 RepID=A0A5E4D524_MARMO|nr:hypothetical protein GHT09_001720 [Marmota monax]KAF7467019.1 hypothetical protein GHT09_001720 [Marmota monax]VTJ88069.1 Hypothetical predicted protein [Marmota monax]